MIFNHFVIENFLILLVAGLHVWFMILEMFLWTRPQGLRAFGQTPEQARANAALASNQGLYNGFLAVGLVWSVSHSDPSLSLQLRIFFLSCVIIAGFYGGWTVDKKIFFVQAGPAIAALAFLGFG